MNYNLGDPVRPFENTVFDMVKETFAANTGRSTMSSEVTRADLGRLEKNSDYNLGFDDGLSIGKHNAEQAAAERERELVRLLKAAKLSEGPLGEAIISDERDDGSVAFGLGVEATIDAILAKYGEAQ